MGKDLFDKNLKKKLGDLESCIENQSKFNKITSELIENLEFEESESKDQEEQQQKTQDDTSSDNDTDQDQNLEKEEQPYEEIINSEFSIIQENKNKEVSPRSHG